ncbi:MAG: GNAT family N-acetyltransferase [Verrucomicrobia bacterium]|nr:GNAT family N-acetyltransferase [Verrucomicrobiota bacterium]
MNSATGLTFKIATTASEFDQIHQLNYRTFVEEIPQHPKNPHGRLVDRFHAENTYLICLREAELIGMLAVRGQRPFSLDQKLANLDSYLPPGHRIVEVRLLAIKSGFRHGPILPGLLKLLAHFCIPQGYDLAIISGTKRQQKLYRHLGFVPFGPQVGGGEAVFQPMFITLATFQSWLNTMNAEEADSSRSPDCATD